MYRYNDATVVMMNTEKLIQHEFKTRKRTRSICDDEMQTSKRKLYVCTVCDEVFSTLQEATVHVQSHTQAGLPQGPGCEEEPEPVGLVINTHNQTLPGTAELLQTAEAATTHIQTHMQQSTPPEGPADPEKPDVEDELSNNVKKPGREKRFPCPICPCRLGSRAGLLRHMVVHTGEKRHQCCVCSRTYGRIAGLTKHMRRLHPGDNPGYKCAICDARFTEMRPFRKHMNVHERERPYKCSVCSMSFLGSSEMMQHLMKHTEADLSTCFLCSKRFDQPSDLAKHMMTHIGEETVNSSALIFSCLESQDVLNACHRCPECIAGFTQEHDLMKHIAMHIKQEASMDRKPPIADAETRPYKCYPCSLRFAELSGFQEHMGIHTSDDLYKCADCGKGFVTDAELNAHSTEHNDQSLHQCSLCGISFKSSTLLQRHALIHKADRPQICPYCGKKCPTMDDLKEHITQQHSLKKVVKKEPRLQCSQCDKTFSQPSLLEKHLVTHRRKRPPSDTSKEVSKEQARKKYLKCPHCNQTAITPEQLQQHIFVIHGKQTPNIRSSGMLPSHNPSEKKGLNICCKYPQCAQTFIHKQELKAHILTHIKRKVSIKKVPTVGDTDAIYHKCQLCNITFVELSAFQKHMELHSLSCVCSVCGKGFMTEAALRAHSAEHTARVLYQCSLCRISFTTLPPLQQHMVLHNSVQARTCPQCGKKIVALGDFIEHIKGHIPKGVNKSPDRDRTASTSHQLQQHIQVNHSIQTPGIGQSDTSSSQKPSQTVSNGFHECQEALTEKAATDNMSYQCYLCKMEFTEISLLEEHMVIHSQESSLYECSDCGEGFTTDTDLKAHGAVHTADKESYTCHLCDGSFVELPALREHMRSQHATYRCPICNKGFTTEGALRGHSTVHTAATLHPCSVCGLSFMSVSSLQQHQIIHQTEPPRICLRCGKKCLTLHNFREHVNQHKSREATDEMNYQCSVCHFNFKTSRRLQQHALLHKTDQAQICPHCGKRCLTMDEFTQHISQHNIKPAKKRLLQCPTCDKTYPSPFLVKKHMVVHTGEKRYLCPVCGKRFAYASGIFEHMKTHTPEEEKPFECSKCNKKFNRSSKLLAHIEKKHPEEDPYRCPPHEETCD